MINIKDLLQAGKLSEAVDALYDGLYQSIKAMPKSNITKEQFVQLSPTLHSKLENPESIVDEPTTEPGDDVQMVPSTALLTIVFDGPRDDGSFKAPEPVVKAYTVGQPFSFVAPAITGYVASPLSVEGVMDQDGVEIHIAYSKVSNPPLYGRVSIIDKDRKIVDRGTIKYPGGDEVWVYYEGTVEWNKSVSDLDHQTHEQWLAGMRIDAPATLKEESDFAGVKMYSVNETAGTSAKPYLFWDALNEEQKKGCYNNLWMILDVDKMQDAFDKNVKLVWTWYFDWNADGGYEQVVHYVIDPTKVGLEEHESKVWPPKTEIEEVAVPEPASEEPVKEVKKTSTKKSKSKKTDGNPADEVPAEEKSPATEEPKAE